MTTALAALAVYLYAFGVVMARALAQDLQHGPIRTGRAWRNILLWPVVIPFAWAGDVYDWYRDR